MKRLLMLLLPLILISFGSRGQNSAVTFQKKFYNCTIDTGLDVVVLFGGNFYCLRSDKQVFTINSKSHLIDKSYHDNSKTIGLENLYLRNDTLIGETRRDTYFLYNNAGWALLRKGITKGKPILTDKNYIVTSTCSGEWGGSLHFRNKKTNKVYECSCTCAVNVIEHQNAYLATASLSHLVGFANIFSIPNPQKLKPLDTGYLKKRKVFVYKGKKTRVGYVGDDESSSKKGTKQLIDSIGITIASSFLLNSTNYFITEKFKNVSIDTIKNGKLVSVDNLTNLNIWCDYPKNRTTRNTQVTTFANEQKTGFIIIEGGQLTFYDFKIERN